MNRSLSIIKPVFYGLAASLMLFVLYLLILTSISGWEFAKIQFSLFWYFIVPLITGFGLQVGLYTYIKSILHKNASGKVLATTGSTSTAAMVSCCAHYLVYLLPLLGATGLVTFVSAYQVQFFWVGLLFNMAGILYMLKTILVIKGVKLAV